MSSVHTDNKGKDILILGKCPTQWLNDTMLTAETQYSINFIRSNIKFCLVCIIMEATFFCFLILQNYINSKQKTLKRKI